ncbi:TPA: DtxR family transcriptional regulator [Candidatus Sumerlaeota bacterium]|jgi:DtxR family transcriptional regulator, Mn-dependent transcriptional regulator|nr:DtxR family transcriptional regulator [Candidatus Sumerlaeota bacterium]
MSEAISGSMEDYLETVYQIVQEHQVARPKDIGKALGVTGPSVTKALRWLADHGFIHYAPFELVTLTEKGEKAAKQVVRKHEALRDFLVRVLAVEAKEADEAACKLEHALSPDILERFIQYADFVDTCPRNRGKCFERFAWHCNQNQTTSDNCETCVGESLDNVRQKKQKKDDAGTKPALLKNMLPGFKGRIAQLSHRTSIGQRLSEMGIETGAVIEVEKVTGEGDMIQIKIKAYHLSLRKEEAAHIRVNPL